MNNNYLIIVAGPAASGKSTLIPKLSSTLAAFEYKPSKAYLDLAVEQGLSVEQAFSLVKRNDAEDYFKNICKNHRVIIGDQHLAIQYNKDSNLAIAIESGSEAPDTPDEEYVPALSAEFIESLLKNGIEVMLLLITAGAETLYQRANFRVDQTGQPLRNKSLAAVIKEREAEHYFFDLLVEETHIPSCVIDTSNMSQSEVYHEALNEIQSILGI